jgi:molybdenum cofactor biosynthesis enzyme MoaA
MLTGREAAETLVRRQAQGVTAAVNAGFTVKVNSVLIPDPERNEKDKRMVRQGDGAGGNTVFFASTKILG